MSQPNADPRWSFCARKAARRRASGMARGRRLASVAACALVLPLVTGCSKYWDRSPTAPEVAHDLTPPTVRVLTPSGPDRERATPVTGAACVVAIAAEDPVGIARVALNVDDAPALAVAGPPWEYRWDTTGLGEGTCHRLWATAVDQAGNIAASDTVFARAFNSGPAVALTAPADGARVKGAIAVAAEVAGGVAIERVEFLADAAVAGTATAAPWSMTFDTGALAPGDHFLTARATTALGLVGVSPSLRIRVNNATPSVAIDFPPPGQRVAAGGTLILSAAALDVVEGALGPERVSWRSDLAGPIGSGTYLRLTGLGAGTHTLTVSAVNAWGTVGTASVVVDVLAQPTYKYSTDIYGGIVALRCLACHYPGAIDWTSHHLDLRTYAGLMAGGDTRAYESIVPCRPESSLVWNKVTAEPPWVGAPMPLAPNPKLPQLLLDRLRTWISEGAPP